MNANIQALLERHKKYFDTIVYCSSIEEIIDELSRELKLNKIDIKRVVDSQFRMLKQVMGNEGLIGPDSKFEDYQSIRLFGLGSFRPSQKKFTYIQDYWKNKLKENGKESST